jgi:hypothetical protein
MTTNRQPARRRRFETRVAAFEDCGTLTAASGSMGAMNLLGGKMRRVRVVCLPASEGVGPRVRIRLPPAASMPNLWSLSHFLNCASARTRGWALRPVRRSRRLFGLIRPTMLRLLRSGAPPPLDARNEPVKRAKGECETAESEQRLQCGGCVDRGLVCHNAGRLRRLGLSW